MFLNDRHATTNRTAENSIASVCSLRWCATYTPIGAHSIPNVAKIPAALYRTMPALRPINAAMPAEIEMAISEMGAASIILISKKSTKSGKERIAPPAPVSANTKPINSPSNIVIWIGSIIVDPT